MPTNQELQDEIDELKGKATKPNLTILMPVFNGSDTIQRALRSIVDQGVRPKIIIMDHGSTDGTLELLIAARESGHYQKLDIDLFQLERRSEDPKVNKCDIRTELSKLPKTKFSFWLDDDVKLPVYALVRMLDIMKNDLTVGMLAINYQNEHPIDPKMQHLGIGATMMPSKILTKIRWECGVLPCECAAVRQQIEKMGLRTGPMLNLKADNLSIQ